MGNLKHELAGPNVQGSGWSKALNGGGYVTTAYHYYAKGETVSVCQVRLRRYKIQGPPPADARKCKACEAWVSGHPDGGVRYNHARRTT